jgi:hypothetical protein
MEEVAVARLPAIDKMKLVSSLEISEDAIGKDDELSADQMSLAHSLLKLANINQEKEHELCRSLAAHLLKNVPEPEEIDLD